MADQTRVLTRNIRPGEPPLDLRGYEDAGGYRALRRAMGESSPEAIRELVKDSGLRGRGGAGFPTGVKWGFVPQGDDARRPRYLVVNVDEMEPGTFKDRLLLYGDPHLMVEAIVLSGWALQMDEGYFFVRWAYQAGADRLRRAVREAREAGYVGENVLGSGWDFEVSVHTSAGRYICGEETALLNSLEGERPNPRFRPPFPAQSGLWGQPTNVQNLETLACVPSIVERGAEWFRDLGAGEDAGTKLYSVSGRVRRPGVYELPIGVSLGELLEEHCGGMRDGYELKAAIPGGASTGPMTADELDVRLDFTSLEATGNRLGTAGVIMIDDDVCMVGLILNLEHFFAQESCGWCTPCRDGLPWIESVLRDLEEGRGQPGDPDLLLEQIRIIGPNSFCALAAGAQAPLEMAVEKFRGEFDAHVRDGGCPFGSGATTKPLGGRPGRAADGVQPGAGTDPDVDGRTP